MKIPVAVIKNETMHRDMENMGLFSIRNQLNPMKIFPIAEVIIRESTMLAGILEKSLPWFVANMVRPIKKHSRQDADRQRRVFFRGYSVDRHFSMIDLKDPFNSNIGNMRHPLFIEEKSGKEICPKSDARKKMTLDSL